LVCGDPSALGGGDRATRQDTGTRRDEVRWHGALRPGRRTTADEPPAPKQTKKEKTPSQASFRLPRDGGRLGWPSSTNGARAASVYLRDHGADNQRVRGPFVRRHGLRTSPRQSGLWSVASSGRGRRPMPALDGGRRPPSGPLPDPPDRRAPARSRSSQPPCPCELTSHKPRCHSVSPDEKRKRAAGAESIARKEGRCSVRRGFQVEPGGLSASSWSPRPAGRYRSWFFSPLELGGRFAPIRVLVPLARSAILGRSGAADSVRWPRPDRPRGRVEQARSDGVTMPRSRAAPPPPRGKSSCPCLRAGPANLLRSSGRPCTEGGGASSRSADQGVFRRPGLGRADCESRTFSREPCFAAELDRGSFFFSPTPLARIPRRGPAAEAIRSGTLGGSRIAALRPPVPQLAACFPVLT